MVWALYEDAEGEGVLDWELPGGRGRGRPRARWIDRTEGR